VTGDVLKLHNVELNFHVGHQINLVLANEGEWGGGIRRTYGKLRMNMKFLD
jgi:hypothetical protein